MKQRKSWRSYGFGLLVAAAGGCAGAENIADQPDGTAGQTVGTPQAGSGGQLGGPTQSSTRTQPATSPSSSVSPPITEPPSVFPPGVATVGGSCAVPMVTKGFPGSPITADLSGPTVRASTPPPPISGGTMLTTRDGTMLIAADPERDQLYFVDIKSSKLLQVRPLLAKDEPGRVIEDTQGRIHVVLRGGGGIATLTRDPHSSITRRAVCSVPRGIAYDAAHDQLHIACAEGRLVSLAAAPSGGVTRQLEIGSDARDVLVRGDQLFVSHFRSAELEVLDANGQRMESMKPATFSREEQQFVPVDNDAQAQSPVDVCSSGVALEQVLTKVESTPSVAWRAIDVPNVGVAMVHQRSRTDEVQVTPGGYGSGSCGSGIVQTSITVGLDKPMKVSADLESLSLAVDMATDPDGELLAIAAPGNFGIQGQVSVLPIANLFALLTAPDQNGNANGPSFPGDAKPGVAPTSMTISMNGPSTSPCVFGGSPLPEPMGQVTALSFASPYMLALQQRNPAAIDIYDLRTSTLHSHIDLQQASTADTGHSMFHVRAGAGVACASCHPEAGDDGHTWTFHGIGARRSQTLRGGLLGTEPFHWNGDMSDFTTLMKEVFVGRMSGFEPRPDQADALADWLDKQPALHADAKDPLAAARGKDLFESKDVGCAECHAGAHRTNNQTRNVGTGAELQVPALKGLLFRTPLMHDGCAPTISSRFSDLKCGGGTSHGHVNQLSSAQLGDLTAYLETL